MPLDLVLPDTVPITLPQVPGRDEADRTSPEPTWKPDVLGGDYEQLTLPLRPDEEGGVVATLVRHTPGAGLPAGALSDADILYVHGWSDYFFQTHVADYWAAQGARFHALDLRKYGRSLRSWQTPGFIDDLADYDEDIDAALSAIGHGSTDSPSRRLLLVGHSTGGLVLSLWADRHPGAASAVILNSPWLEFQGDTLGRVAATPILALSARFKPLGELPRLDLGHYARSLLRRHGGEWDYDLLWRPEHGFPATPAWLRAILAGHTAVARGLQIDAPVFVWLSSSSVFGAFWNERMRYADVALDVDEVAQRALRLGPVVTVTRVADAVHDVMLSRADVRATAEGALTRWLRGYVY
ncbi:MAG TPA: alpha/beta hydrolase [Naasia sp.]|jgi:alpha-beta hydrolase superfamily lysophospholipase